MGAAARGMKNMVEFPDGPREIDGEFIRRDNLRGAQMLVEHPYWSVEIWVPNSVAGYRFRQTPDETWAAEPVDVVHKRA